LSTILSGYIAKMLAWSWHSGHLSVWLCESLTTVSSRRLNALSTKERAPPCGSTVEVFGAKINPAANGSSSGAVAPRDCQVKRRGGIYRLSYFSPRENHPSPNSHSIGVHPACRASRSIARRIFCNAFRSVFWMAWKETPNRLPTASNDTTGILSCACGAAFRFARLPFSPTGTPSVHGSCRQRTKAGEKSYRGRA